MINNICIYTSIIGGYEDLNPIQIIPGIDFLCFTDHQFPESRGWKIVPITPLFPMDNIRSQRYYKINSHLVPELNVYSLTLYIDNTVRLKSNIMSLFTQIIQSPEDIFFIKHSYRFSLQEEFFEAMQNSLDSNSRLSEQYNHYFLEDQSFIHRPPIWGGFILRKNTKNVETFNNLWFAHVLRYSRRDQLSLPYCLESSHVLNKILDLDNFSSLYHEWPIFSNRIHHQRHYLPHIDAFNSTTHEHTDFQSNYLNSRKYHDLISKYGLLFRILDYFKFYKITYFFK